MQNIAPQLGVGVVVVSSLKDYREKSSALCKNFFADGDIRTRGSARMSRILSLLYIVMHLGSHRLLTLAPVLTPRRSQSIVHVN